MRLSRGDLHTLAGPYALDALTGPDRDRFERHLGRCEPCRQEAGSLREAAAWLPEVTRAGPPEGLRARVLAAAAATRQAPPVTPGMGQQAVLARRDGRSPVLVPRLALAVASGIILVLLAVGSLALTSQHRVGQDRAHSRAIAEVMTAPDARMVTGRAAAGGTCTVVMSHSDRALVLTTRKLPPLPAAKGYQVWLMGPSGVRKVGMLPRAHQGMTAPMVVSGLASKDEIALTAEPAAGSSHPTSHMILVLALP